MRFTKQQFFICKLYGIICILIIMSTYLWFWQCMEKQNYNRMVPANGGKINIKSDDKTYTYSKDTPIIFIGGVPRSGTTLMRALLDAHPDIRCGEETRVIPRLLGMHNQWFKSSKELKRLNEAGLTNEVIDSALTAFILEIIAKHGEPAKHLCNKDPFTLKSASYLSNLFPNGKFLLMIRDGRAVVHSIISRHVTISGFNLNDYSQCMKRWNDAILTMTKQCSLVGSDRCLIVYYEQLVLHPKKIMEDILNFLNIPWSSDVLHHEKFINKKGGISLSKVERSTDQVIKPINLDALTNWASEFPIDVQEKIESLAPMMTKLGYDINKFPPNYGKADKIVAKNTNEIHKKPQYWADIATKIMKGDFDFIQLNKTATNP